MHQLRCCIPSSPVFLKSDMQGEKLGQFLPLPPFPHYLQILPQVEASVLNSRAYEIVGSQEKGERNEKTDSI